MDMQTYLASTRRRSDLADDDLVQQAQIGDPGAFEILVNRYSPLLLLLISRMVRDEHLALARAAHERGELLLGGAFAEPTDHALLVWSADDEDVVRRFVDADPYVADGLVKSWHIRQWTVVIGA